MERRAQMVINTCTGLGEQSPIAMIHDVGAGGLSNALPERMFLPLFTKKILPASRLYANNPHSREGCWLWRQL